MTAARSGRWAWLCGVGILTLSITIQWLRDPDVYWHLAMGQHILHAGIPSVEPFSFVHAQFAWTGQQWLYEVLLSTVVTVGGAPLASLVMGIVATTAFLVASAARPQGTPVSNAWRAGAVILSVVVSGQLLGVRGQVMTLLDVAIELFVLQRWRDGHHRSLWVLPPIFLIWCNLHAGFITGFAILALAIVLFPKRDLLRTPSGRTLSCVTVACLAITFANPAGVGLYGYIIDTFANPTITNHAIEWLSPDFHNWFLRLFAVEALLVVVVWMMSGGPTLFDALLAGGAFVASLHAQRNVSLFALVVVPQIAYYGTRAWTTRAPMRWQRLPRHHPVMGLVAVVTIALLTAMTVTPRLTTTATQQFERESFPSGAASYVAAHYAGERLYAPIDWGGYLAYRFPLGRVVYVYTELGVFGRAVLNDYLDIALIHPTLPERLSELDIHHAVVGVDGPERSALRELGWTTDCYDAESQSMVMSVATTLPSTIPVLPEDPIHLPSCS